MPYSLCFPTPFFVSSYSWAISSTFMVPNTICKLITPKSTLPVPNTSLSFRVTSSCVLHISTWTLHQNISFTTSSCTPQYLLLPSKLASHSCSWDGSVMSPVSQLRNLVSFYRLPHFLRPYIRFKLKLSKLNILVSNSIYAQYLNTIYKCVSEVCPSRLTIIAVQSTQEDFSVAGRSISTFL